MVGSKRSRSQGVGVAMLGGFILAPGIGVGHGFLIAPASIVCVVGMELLSNGQDPRAVNLIVNGLSLAFTLFLFLFVESESRDAA
jgi:multisubunit Na+/H+ antiporter MnhB subunit